MPATKRFSITIEIQALHERVWKVMKDVERWYEWTSTVRKIRILGAGSPITVGSRMLIIQPKLPPAIWKVVQLDEGQGFHSVTGSPLMHVHAHHRLEPHGSATRVTLAIEMTGPLAGVAAALTRKLNERYLAIEANGLKQRSESAIQH